MILSTIAVLGTVILSSCSIKEDRSPCPCWLDIFFNGFPHEGVVIAGYSSDKVLHDMVSEDEFTDFVEYSVPRTLLSVSAFRVNPAISLDGKMVKIKKGDQADSLYAHQSYVDCRGECAVDTVTLHKQFATVYLTFENSEGESVNSYDVVVRGNVSGIDITTLQPAEGEFEFKPKGNADGLYVFRLPRQKDSSIAIDLYRTDNGEFIDTIDAGTLIERSGYDWRARDLQDIVINVDFAKMGIDVSVRSWDSEEIYEVTI